MLFVLSLFGSPHSPWRQATSNQSPSAVTVQIDSKVYDLSGKQLEDLLDGKPFAVSGQTVRMDVGGKNGRILLLRK